MPGSTGERAATLFASDRLLCAESVLRALAEGLGVESGLIPGIATGFCSGFGRTCGPCGALTGAVMGIGLAAGRRTADDELAPCYLCVQELKAPFLAEYGSANCFELTGCDFRTKEGQALFKERNLSNTLCRNLVRFAAQTAMSILSDHGLA